jgi:transposase InsO family protein
MKPTEQQRTQQRNTDMSTASSVDLRGLQRNAQLRRSPCRSTPYGAPGTHRDSGGLHASPTALGVESTLRISEEKNRQNHTTTEIFRVFENSLSGQPYLGIVIRFPNLVAGREVTGVNQVWVIDITYYLMEGRFYYLTFIMDLYSRLIVGYSVSRDRSTKNTTIPALKMALQKRTLTGELIIHSDGGGQYYGADFLRLDKGLPIIHSMGTCAFDNAYAERINGIIKNDYLTGYAPFDYPSLQRKTAKAVHMYNEQHPHSSLNKMSPVVFEQSGLAIPTQVYEVK